MIEERPVGETKKVSAPEVAQFPAVTIAVINFNGLANLGRSLASVLEIDYADFEVMIVDNGSTDSSVAYVNKHFRQIKVHRLATNRGPNAARNFALLNARNRYLFLLDNDAFVSKDCLTKLVSTLRSRPAAAVCSPLVVDSENPMKVQYGATHIHYIGAAIIENTCLSNSPDGIVTTATTLNGTAMLIDREKTNKVVLFDEEMFFGWTDGDYSFRLTAAGYECLIVHESKVMHPASKRSKSFVYHQVKNRWVFILKNYSWRTVILTIPALMFYEMALFFFLLITGHLKEYLLGINAIIQHIPKTLKKRHVFFTTKRLSDKTLLRSGDFLSSQFIVKGKYLKRGIRFFSTVLDGYWLLIKPFI